MPRSKTISAKELRQSLPEIVERVRRGESYTVVYRSRPAFRLVPIDAPVPDVPLADDPLFEGDGLGRSSDGATSRDHDEQLYGSGRK